MPDGYEKSEGFPGLMGPPGRKGMRRHPGGPTGGETTESKEKVED